MLLLTSLTTPSLASDHDCKQASILNVGVEAHCSGALIGIEQLRRATLCAKEAVPRLEVALSVCKSLRESERSFFQKKLKAMWKENEALTIKAERSERADAVNKFLWGASGVTLGAIVALVVML